MTINTLPIETNQLQQLSSRVFRLTAPNPGIMTGPGTNTYIVKMGPNETLVIDPGPALTSHITSIKAALNSIGGSLRWIFCTHSHKDHSPAANELKQRCGGIIVGMLPKTNVNQDQSFSPDQIWQHQNTLNCENSTLEVVHTPGHASNHLCYYLREEKLLFTGDHIMEGSTVVISPPDGNMTQYIDSLRNVMKLELSHLAPAHGGIINEPHLAIKKLIKHRQLREAKALRMLKQWGPNTIEGLTTHVYDDVPEARHPIATHSLLAHLEKLNTEGKALLLGNHWKISENTL